MKKWFIPTFALAGLLVLSIAPANAASPFEKAGLSKNAGKVMTSKQADNVRGGFRDGGQMLTVLASLGVDTSGSREAIRAQIQAIGRDAIRAAMTEAGVTPPQAGSRPARPQGASARQGARSRTGSFARRNAS